MLARPDPRLFALATLCITSAVAIRAVGAQSPFAPDASVTPASEAVDFAKQVLPVLTQAGCNSGACHGAAEGRGYLRLSLFAARPAEDYQALMLDNVGRYVDWQQPEFSKLLQKPNGELEHGGDLRLESESSGFDLLRQWIAQGGQRGELHTVVSLSATPANRLVVAVGETSEVRISAEWSDGAVADITRWVALTDSDALDVSTAPLHCALGERSLSITPRQAGYWPLTIRFCQQTLTLQLYVSERAAMSNPSNSAVDRPVPVDRPVSGSDAVDVPLAATAQELGMSLAEPTSSRNLVRRWWLDLAGRPPTLDEWDRATGEVERGRASEVVEQLLDSPEFYSRAASEITAWCESAGGARQAPPRLTDALAAALADSDRLPQLVRKMLWVPAVTSDPTDLASRGLEGGSSPLVDFHRLAVEPRGRVEWIASAWLGVRIGCARCHDHPLDHWTQDDYFGMAACWAEIDVQGESVRRLPGATTTDLRTGREARPHLPGEARPTNLAGALDHHFVQWMVGEENTLFRRNVVNRIWGWLMGVALIQPVDDQRATNPALHARVLDSLEREFQASQGSLKSLVRAIVLSEAYARQSKPQSTKLEYDALAVRRVKPLTAAPQRLAAMCLAVDVESAMALVRQDEPGQAKMGEGPAAGCARSQPCADPTSRSLELVSGPSLNAWVQAAIVGRWDTHGPPRELMIDLHRRLFGEAPTSAEMERWPLAMIPEPVDAPTQTATKEACEDLLWSWLVSDRFLTLQ